MSIYKISFFILAVLSGAFGFGAPASNLTGTAQFLALIFVIFFMASLIHDSIMGDKIRLLPQTGYLHNDTD